MSTEAAPESRKTRAIVQPLAKEFFDENCITIAIRGIAEFWKDREMWLDHFDRRSRPLAILKQHEIAHDRAPA